MPSGARRWTPSSDAANRWIFPDLAEEPWAGVQWIAIPFDPSRATHAVDMSGIGDTAVRSLVAHEQYLRGLGVEDPVAYADGDARAARRLASRRVRRPGAASGSS